MITMQHIFDDARQGIVWIARNPLYNAAIMRHYIKAPAWCRRAALCFSLALAGEGFGFGFRLRLLRGLYLRWCHD